MREEVYKIKFYCGLKIFMFTHHQIILPLPQFIGTAHTYCLQPVGQHHPVHVLIFHSLRVSLFCLSVSSLALSRETVNLL